nr:hypothetical protein [Tanacetum cinerariifolium]
MQTRSSSRLVSNPSSNPTPSTNLNPKGCNRRRSKQRIEDFNLEELSPPIVTMADQCTMAQLLQAPTEGYEDAIVVPAITAYNFELKHELNQLDTFYNALNLKYQDSLNFAAGGNFLDKMPRECLAIIDSKSKVCYSRNKPVVSKVSTHTSTSGISPDVAKLKDMVKALLLDKKGQNQSPTPVKAVEESYQAPTYQALAPQTQGVSKEDFSAYVKANDAVMRNMQTQAITTRSGVSYDGPQIPPPPSFLPKVVEDELEATKDTVNPTNNESTEDVQPQVVQSKSPISTSKPVTSLISKPVIALITISTQDLIVKEKIESQSETIQTVSARKLPMLKTRDYDLWSMRMEQYLTYTDYALWDGIMNGDAPTSITSVNGGAEATLPPKTTVEKITRRNELKAKSTLLLSIPDEHLLKFHGIKDAKTLWKALKTRFGGNKEYKKIQKTILKQQYENFVASRSKGLDKTYDKFQKLISQLEIHGEVILQEDANLKLLKSLLPAWNTHTLIMRNKSDLDTLRMDDLYTNLKVYEAKIKGQSSSSPISQNMAFVSLYNTNSTNEAVNTAHSVSAASLSGKASTSTNADDVMFFFFANQSNSPQLDNEDLERGHFARECRAPTSQENRNGDNTRGVVPVETPANALVVTDGMGYDWSYQAKEGPTYFALMAFSSSGSSSSDTETGLGYDSQITKRDLSNKSDVFESASDSSVNESKEDNIQANDRYRAGEGYHAVPPPYTGNFMPLRHDLSFTGLDDSVFKSALSEPIASAHKPETSTSKTSKESMENPKTVRPSAPIIEYWEFDSDDNCEIRPSIEQNKPSHAKINFVKSDENTRKSVIEQHTYKQVENLGKSLNSRVDKRDWNEMMTQKLGNGFKFKKKACFVCGSLYHLIKDCNFYKNKMVGKSVLNNNGKATSQREVRPVWNNAKRVNHHYFPNNLSHPHLRRNFVPTTMITNSGKVQVNAAKQISPRAATSTSTARYVNTAANRPTGNRGNVVKSSACWSWRPTGNVIDHISKDNGSYMLKRFNYVALQGRLKSAMAWAYDGKQVLPTDYQEIDGGFVAFGGSPKGGKISGKCTIRTGKLDFEDTECLVLSPDFKLPDENQVLLKVTRHNNMYSFDLKNVVPTGGSAKKYDWIRCDNTKDLRITLGFHGLNFF